MKAADRLIDVDIIFLAGGPRRSPIERRTGWPLHLLPIGKYRNLLVEWRSAIEGALAESMQMRAGSWQILLSQGQEPWPTLDVSGVSSVFETRPHRGTAGALRDHQFQAGCGSELILVVELSASPVVGLGPLLANGDAVRASRGVCVVGESSLGRYCGVTLCHRFAFELVPEVGFFDFKEQLLPAIRAAGAEIRPVVIADRARRIRTRREWLEAVTAWQEIRAQSEPCDDRSSRVRRQGGGRSLVDPGAVTDGATIVNSIIMDEAVVEAGAVVARSVIGPGMRVPAGARVIDSMVADPAVGRAVLQRRESGVLLREADG